MSTETALVQCWKLILIIMGVVVIHVQFVFNTNCEQDSVLIAMLLPATGLIRVLQVRVSAMCVPTPTTVVMITMLVLLVSLFGNDL